MTQFQSTGPRILQAVQQAPMAQKKKQTKDRLNDPNNKTTLRDRRRMALINQGVDPDQLNRGVREDRGQHSRLMRQSREAFRSGNTAQGEALRAQADRLKYDINDRFKLSRPTLRDLPVDQQAAQRAQSREQLNAQLPQIAANAKMRETEATAENTQRLARIGREAYRLEIGGKPPENMSDEAFAEFARGADRNVINRVTRGVGLPASPTTGDADRLSRLAEDGVQFGAFTPGQRADNPSTLARVRTGQAQDQLDQQTRLAIRGNERDAARIGSQVQPAQAQNALAREQSTVPLLRSREEAEAQLGVTQARRDTQNTQTQAQIDQIQGDRALARESGTAASSGSVIDRAGITVTDNNIESIQALTQGIPRLVERANGSGSSSKTAKEIKSALDEVGTLALRPDITPQQKSVIAKELLSRIEEEIGNKNRLVRDSVPSIARRAAISAFGGSSTIAPESSGTREQNRDFAEMIRMLRSMAGE